MVESWDAAEDSEEEREKAKKAAAAKAKAEEEARKNHKSKSQRIEERRAENMRRKQEEEEETSSEEESETERRQRLRRTEQAADLKHAEDLFDSAAGPKDRSAPTRAFVATDATGKAQSVDLASLPLLKPTTKDQFAQLRGTLAPLLAANAKKPQYALFLQEFVKDLTRELPSEQTRKIASALTAFSNERMREEKAAEKGGKKAKAKGKATLVAARDVSSRADTTAYEDDLGE